MARNERIEFTADIAAPVTTVFRLMLDPQAYRDWTSPFAEGSHFVGSWQQGQKIRFLSPCGDGMVSEIADHRPDAFISIRHLGYVTQGLEDTQSDAVRAWAPAYENYRFLATPTGTRLVIEQDATPEFKAYLAEAWPKALRRLQALCEAAAR